MGIVRLSVGGGTPEGMNSAYLVDGRVLVDPGPPTDGAWEELRSGLESRLERLTDLEYVVCTHWHADHVGLAPRLADAAGATIAIGAGDAPLLGEYGSERERRLERDANAMRVWGVPAKTIASVTDGDRPSPVPVRCDVSPLEAGDELAGATVLETPGHTAGHIALEMGTDHALMVGDAVLPTYTPNVGGSDTRLRGTDPLGTYLETLDRIESREGVDDGSVALLPGHGSTCSSNRLETIRDHHRERTVRVREALGKLGSSTPWDVAIHLFGSLEGIHTKFGAGEAAAHLEYLERESVVARDSDGTYWLVES
ncbi:MBL fold metallo-hydrolase [Natronosalvus vescus]|uniref:MBL fold metallo-hydrolase n=1 Tax=Natronosalvus vescus TaxID=2953881 RepID=UPI0020915960|nr:MBL fold metallo-hydrolase [Natronosalvus vescus]